NVALLTTLPTRHDTIYFDEFVHASSRDGIRASLAEKKSFAHNNISELECELKKHAMGQAFIVIESVYSMDGDEAPLSTFVALAKAHNAVLIVDEAHATGVFGQFGEGLIVENQLRDQIVISVHTCGKALGAAGAFVVCS